MGNKVPESHNQLDNNNSYNKVENPDNLENEVDLVVNSVVTDLIDSVLIRDSIMSKENCKRRSLSDAKYEDTKLSAEPDMDQTCDDMDISYASCLNTTIIEGSPQIDLMGTSITAPFDKPHEEGIILWNANEANELSNESEYTPKRSSPVNPTSYSKLSRVSPTPPTTSDNDCKYLNNGYSKRENNFKIDDNVLDSWNLNESNPRNNGNTFLSRSSLYRQFDPLVEDKYSKMLRSTSPKLNESTGLTEKFEWLKIAESPKSDKSNGNYQHITSPKPDVLAFAIEEVEDKDTKEHEQQYEDKLKAKDVLIDDLKNESEEKITKLMKLIETYHYINEELVQLTSQELQKKDLEIEKLKGKCNSLTTKRSQALDEVKGIERSFSDLHIRYDKLRNDLTITKENENLYQQQYESAVNKVQELENICRNLQSKVGTENKQSGIENELSAVKVQYKRAEMKINSLQNQLDQKTRENTELSSMVDELIVKVRN